MAFKQNRRCNISVNRKFIFALLITLCLLSVNHADARDSIRDLLLPEDDAPWPVEADKIAWDKKNKVIEAEGDAVISNGPVTLSSDKVFYNYGDRTAEALTDFVFESEEDRLSGKKGQFDLNNKTGRIEQGNLFITEGNYHITGDLLEKGPDNTYEIKNFSLTTCDGECPAWSITGREVHVPLEGYATAKGAAFRIYDVPVFYVPWLIFPAKTKRETGFLLPSAGYSDLNGVELELPFFWAISDQTDVTFYERYMSDRGVMHGLEFRYVTGSTSKGILSLDILSDRIDQKDMGDPEQAELSPFLRTNETRYKLKGRAEQQLPAGISARADLDVVSDQDYLREFEETLTGFETRPDLVREYGRPSEERSSPFRRSALRLSRDRQNYTLQAAANYYQRPEEVLNDTTSQPLMGASYSLLPRSLKMPVSFALDADYDYIWRDFGQKGHNFSLTPHLILPARIGSYLEFHSYAGYTRDMQWLSDDSLNPDYQSRDAYMFRTGFSTVLDRIYDTDWNRTKKVRHKITPSLAYEYRSHRDEGLYRPWFDPIDAEGDYNRVVFSVENFLDARFMDEDGNASYSRLGIFRLSQGYDLNEAKRDDLITGKREPFEPLTAELTLTPFDTLNLDSEVQWDHYSNDVSFADLSLALDIERANGRRDEYRIDYVYRISGDKGLAYFIKVNLMAGFSVGSSLNRDIEMDNDIENSYWVEYDSQCWGMRLGVDRRDEDSRIMLSFQMLGFGK